MIYLGDVKFMSNEELKAQRRLARDRFFQCLKALEDGRDRGAGAGAMVYLQHDFDYAVNLSDAIIVEMYDRGMIS